LFLLIYLGVFDFQNGRFGNQGLKQLLIIGEGLSTPHDTPILSNSPSGELAYLLLIYLGIFDFQNGRFGNQIPQ